MESVARRRLLWIGLLLILIPAAIYLAWPTFENPEGDADRLLSLLHLRPGMAAAEIGAGEARLSLQLARRLGPQSRILVTELGDDKLSTLRKAAAASNINVIEAGESSSNLPPQCCDAILLRKVYHHITQRQSINASIVEALRPGGRLAIIDFPPRSIMFWLPKVEGMPTGRTGHGVTPEDVIREITAAGLQLESRIDDWTPINFCLIFRKPPLH